MSENIKVKAKKQDLRLRELFRQKLEAAEVIPSSSLNAKLMRKLAFREFLHFNPARFNAYYLGGLLVAGLTTAILISPAEKQIKQLPVIRVPERIIENAKQDKADTGSDKKIVPAVVLSVQTSPEIIGKKLPDSAAVINSQNKTASADRSAKIIIKHTDIGDSFSKKNIFNQVSDEDNKTSGRDKA